MFMQSIRRATKKHRTLLIIVVFILCVGVVGTFAKWDSSFSAQTSGSDWDNMTFAEKAAVYEDNIAENEPATVAETDYATASSMASLYQEYISLLSSAYQDLYSTAATDTENDYTEQLNAYAGKITAAAEKETAYLQQTIDIAPAELNDLALGQSYAKLAAAKMTAGVDVAVANADMDKAIELAPDDVNVNCIKADMLANSEGYQAAADYLTGFLSTLEEGTDSYNTVYQYMYLYQLYAKAAAGELDTGEGEDASGSEDEADPAADEAAAE